MPDIIGRAAVEIAQLFSPLRVALEDGDELAIFLRRFGLPIGGEHVASIGSSLSPLRDGVVGLIDAAQDALADGVDAADVAALVDAAGPLFNTVQSIGPSVSSLAGAVPSGPAMQPFDQVVAGFPDELLDLLLADYLSARIPVALHVLSLLDVARFEEIPAEGHPLSRGLVYVRHHFDWQRIAQLFERPEEWALEAYGWGADFDSDTFIAKLMRVFEAFGGVASLDEMSGAEMQVFLPDWPEPTPPAAQSARAGHSQGGRDGERPHRHGGVRGSRHRAVSRFGQDGSDAHERQGIGHRSLPRRQRCRDRRFRRRPDVACARRARGGRRRRVRVPSERRRGADRGRRHRVLRKLRRRDDLCARPAA